jgi:hypothetical protein
LIDFMRFRKGVRGCHKGKDSSRGMTSREKLVVDHADVQVYHKDGITACKRRPEVQDSSHEGKTDPTVAFRPRREC